MTFSLMAIPAELLQQQAAGEIIKCNDYTYQYGLTLTRAQALSLIETRSYALRATGRIEFGGGIIEKFIRAFCDSPFLSAHNYAETLNELIEVFYYFKNETENLIKDDDLIDDIKKAFNGFCQGSVELLFKLNMQMTKSENLNFDYNLDFTEGDNKDGKYGDYEEDDEDEQY